MYDTDVRKVCWEIERKMKRLPAYFYCQHPADSAPVRILVSGLRYWQRAALREKLQCRGFKVSFWQARFKGYG